MIAAGAHAAAIVPVWANGELRGVLGLTWAQSRVFDEDERAFVLTLGVMCAQAIMRAHLIGAERIARVAADTARTTAEHANQSKAHFVATISHELRTPMNAVLGYTALLADEIYGPVSALQKEHIGRVRSSGFHLLGLIEDLLSYARVEAGHEVVHAEVVSLVDIIDASLELVRPLAEKKGLSMRVESPPEAIAMFTDPRKLRQILINLLANAVKFTETGSIVLIVRVDADRRYAGEFRGHGYGPRNDHRATNPHLRPVLASGHHLDKDIRQQRSWLVHRSPARTAPWGRRHRFEKRPGEAARSWSRSPANYVEPMLDAALAWRWRTNPSTRDRTRMRELRGAGCTAFTQVTP